MTRHFTIMLMKTWWKSIDWCRRYSTFFSVFPGDTFSTCKMETKLFGNLHSCCTLFVELEYLDHNPQPSRIAWIIYKKNDCFHSIWKSKIFGKKDKLLLCVHTGFRIHLNFTTIYPFARSVVQSLKKGGRGSRKLSIVRKNRMAGICFCKSAIKNSTCYRPIRNIMSQTPSG